MLFNSTSFLIFFLITFSIYYLPACQRIQVPILIVASLIFYAWSSPWLLILLISSILLNSIISYKVIYDRADKRLFWALLGVVINLSILSLFKYGALLTNLVVGTFNSTNAPEEGIIALLLHLPLPIGISFYTFEGISLLIDVLRQRNKQVESETTLDTYYVVPNLIQHILNTSFFIAFFPHLIAGPILKSKNFYPQIGSKSLKNVNWQIVFHSLVVGYFLKMFVADNLKEYTFWINFPYYQGLGTITDLVLLFGYSMQIFADFAGYSLIAIGLAAALGYELPQNFNFPYISRSISEFWRRWHISLSTWLRDYLYFPLGGNRKGKIRTYLNLMIVMTLGGLWHGAAWSYAVWGIFHGLGLALERCLALNEKPQEELINSRPKWQQFLGDTIRVFLVFSFVTLGWLLFKLPNFEQAIDFLRSMSTEIYIKPQLSKIVPVLIFSLPVIVYHLPHFPGLETPIAKFLGSEKNIFACICKDVAIAVMIVCLLLNSGNSDEFIYFQF